MNKLTRYFPLSVLIFYLSGCAWYQGPEPMPKLNSDGSALSDFYSGPQLPEETANNSGDFEVKGFNNQG
ncbi:hypothetical protein ACFPDQ_05340 [Pseudofrancisella aestuarii]|uniref:Lipoprotein n=2 Tax=Francisellaceae TaxID=34064 RepID=A0ABV9TBG0_9GAMM|nr:MULTISPECIES: hypothetical protein [Francisellaceae]APC96492.1 putative lipoprotein [Francisella frigiditurris]